MVNFHQKKTRTRHFIHFLTFLSSPPECDEAPAVIVDLFPWKPYVNQGTVLISTYLNPFLLMIGVMVLIGLVLITHNSNEQPCNKHHDTEQIGPWPLTVHGSGTAHPPSRSRSGSAVPWVTGDTFNDVNRAIFGMHGRHLGLSIHARTPQFMAIYNGETTKILWFVGVRHLWTNLRSKFTGLTTRRSCQHRWPQVCVQDSSMHQGGICGDNSGENPAAGFVLSEV